MLIFYRKRLSFLSSLVVVVVVVFSFISLFLQHEFLPPVEPHAAFPLPLRLQESSSNSINNKKRPELRDLFNFSNSKEVIGDPQFLLDFAIIGFPKCGTTALHAYLNQSSEVQLLEGETMALLNERPDFLVKRLYTQLSESPQVQRGYKNPLDIRSPPSLHYLAKIFPRTTLIIGIRHPVRWMESLYNFKVQNLPRRVDPSYWGDPNLLIGKCQKWNDTNCVGTAKGYFHVHLAALGKAPFPDEWREEYPLYLNDKNMISLPNRIFLYETQQLDFSSNEAYARQFRFDLHDFLNLKQSLPTTILKIKPDYKFNKRLQRRKNRFKIDICKTDYQPLRDELMKVASLSSTWIRKEFLNSPDVHVSSRPYFEQLLEDWLVDPCATYTRKR